MMAASARTSGTSRPNSSTVKRGVCSSRSSRARAAARARASCARRARAVLAEYAFFLAVELFALAGVFEAVFGFDCRRRGDGLRRRQWRREHQSHGSECQGHGYFREAFSRRH